MSIEVLRAWQKSREGAGPFQVPEYHEFAQIVQAMEAQVALIADAREIVEGAIAHGILNQIGNERARALLDRMDAAKSQ